MYIVGTINKLASRLLLLLIYEILTRENHMKTGRINNNINPLTFEKAAK